MEIVAHSTPMVFELRTELSISIHIDSHQIKAPIISSFQQPNDPYSSDTLDAPQSRMSRSVSLLIALRFDDYAGVRLHIDIPMLSTALLPASNW